MAMPASRLALEPVGLAGDCWASAASEKLPTNSVTTVAPGTAPSSCTIPPAVPEATGASLTGATITDSGTVPALTAVVPPLFAPKTFTPAIAWVVAARSAPVVEPVTIVFELSIKRTVRTGGWPLKLADGTNSSRAVADRTSALMFDTDADTAVQLVPPSIE